MEDLPASNSFFEWLHVNNSRY